MNTRTGNTESISNLNGFPQNIMCAAGFLGCDKLTSNCDYSFISKILHIMPSKLLIYGKHDKISEQQLITMGIDYRVYPDIHRLSKGGGIMADAKTPCSTVSNYYATNTIQSSTAERGRYNRSKEREKKFNNNWQKQKVNINDIVDQFAPNSIGTTNGVKFNFEGSRYIVKADMASGYLRIYDKVKKSYIKLDGTPSYNGDETHFKIKKKEEM